MLLTGSVVKISINNRHRIGDIVMMDDRHCIEYKEYRIIKIQHKFKRAVTYKYSTLYYIIVLGTNYLNWANHKDATLLSKSGNMNGEWSRVLGVLSTGDPLVTNGHVTYLGVVSTGDPMVTNGHV